MASQITGVSGVCSTVCSGEDQRKQQSSASLAFVRGIHRWPVDSCHKGPVTRKMFSFDDVITRNGNICQLIEAEWHIYASLTPGRNPTQWWLTANWTLINIYSMNFRNNLSNHHSRKSYNALKKCRLQIGGNFVPTPMSYNTAICHDIHGDWCPSPLWKTTHKALSLW